MIEKPGPLEVIFKVLEAVLLIVGFKEVSEAKNTEDRRAAILQHLPRLFGFGRSDEAIFGSLLTALDDEHRAALSKLVRSLSVDEATSFILTVAMMPNDIKVNKDGQVTSAIEFSENDRRVLFLKNLVDDFNMCKTEDDVKNAVAFLQSNHFTEEGRLSKLQKTVRGIVFDILNIESWDDLREEHIAEAIRKAGKKLKEYRAKQYKPSLLGKLFGV